jgi:hypothetical protein
MHATAKGGGGIGKGALSLTVGAADDAQAHFNKVLQPRDDTAQMPVCACEAFEHGLVTSRAHAGL